MQVLSVSACNYVNSRCPQKCLLVSGCLHVPMLANGKCLHACAPTYLYVHAFTHRHVCLHVHDAEPRPCLQNRAPEVCRTLERWGLPALKHWVEWGPTLSLGFWIPLGF